MFGIFGNVDSAIERLKDVVPEGEWQPGDGRLGGSANFPRIGVVCTLALELGFHPSYDYTVDRRLGRLTIGGCLSEALAGVCEITGRKADILYPNSWCPDGFVIECICNEEVSTITVGDWLPESLPRVYEITKEEIDGLYLNIPNAYQYAISN